MSFGLEQPASLPLFPSLCAALVAKSTTIGHLLHVERDLHQLLI